MRPAVLLVAAAALVLVCAGLAATAWWASNPGWSLFKRYCLSCHGFSPAGISGSATDLYMVAARLASTKLPPDEALRRIYGLTWDKLVELMVAYGMPKPSPGESRVLHEYFTWLVENCEGCPEAVAAAAGASTVRGAALLALGVAVGVASAVVQLRRWGAR